MHTPEFFEKKDIAKYLDSIGAWNFKPLMAGYGKAGVPDIIACVPLVITQDMVGMRVGTFVGIEVKREGKQPTELQKARMLEIVAAGGVATAGTANAVIPQIKMLPGLWK
jgi:hypothetical protein